MSSGNANNCNIASATPAHNPQPNIRSATPFARATPPPSFLRRRSSPLGTNTAATEDRAKSTTPPSCQTCIAIVCAAAALPAGSMAWVARVTLRKAMLRATDRARTPAPPVSKGNKLPSGGGFRALRGFAASCNVPRFNRSRVYVSADVTLSGRGR